MLIALVVAVLVIKALYVQNRRFSSDELQHLHVVWGWTQGLVQYRDYFDNHTPLFHLAMAPIANALGEHADLAARMRLVMLPLWALSCGAVGWLAAQLYSRQAGIFALFLAAACPVLLMAGSEFRADILWLALWMATVSVTFAGPFTRLRAFATGLLLGATFGTSMKTSLLAFALLLAFGTTLLLLPAERRKEWLAGGWGKALWLILGVGIVPAALVLYFAEKNALNALVYNVFQHNMGGTPHANATRKLMGSLVLAIAAAVALYCRPLLRRETGWQLQARRCMVALVPLFFHAFLVGFWPLVTRQDYLPSLPLVAVPLAGYLVSLPCAALACSGILVLELIVAVVSQSPFHREDSARTQLVRDVLNLAPQNAFVMDAKGENIFRQRPFYFCLETITRRKLRMGVIPDTIQERMMATHTCLCAHPRVLTDASRAWVERTFLPISPELWVAGCHIPQGNPGEPRAFEVGIDTQYQFATCEGEPAPVTIDGIWAENGLVTLTPGQHRVITATGAPLDLILHRAFRKGYRPLPQGVL